MQPDLHALAHLEFGYLTTVGRVTGRLHTIEIWFALHDRTVYMLAGDHASDWVRYPRLNDVGLSLARPRRMAGPPRQ